MIDANIAAAVAAMTSDDPTDEQIVRVIETIRDAYPDLSSDGFLIDMRFRPRDAAERKTRHDAARREMTHPVCVREFRAAWEWLTADGGPLLTEKINRKSGTSYSWKHVAEDWHRDAGRSGYSSNGLFICAALAAGCSIERTAPDDLNAWLNLSAFMLPVRDYRTGQRHWRDRQAARKNTLREKLTEVDRSGFPIKSRFKNPNSVQEFLIDPRVLDKTYDELRPGQQRMFDMIVDQYDSWLRGEQRRREKEEQQQQQNGRSRSGHDG